MDEADTMADLLNNTIGRSIGLENKGINNKGLAEKVLNEYYINGLWEVKSNSSGKYGLQKSKISKAQYEKALQVLQSKGYNGLNF